MKKIAIALLTILSIISVSCQIGLGAAVDTEPPALTIQNPPIDSVIRDDFAIVGTYSDDGKIESVVAQVERTDGSGYSETFTGVLNGKIKARTEGTYTIVIPAKTSKITDGSYQAIVTIKDETGRTTIRNTTFTIDNTPPVIVLQRPGTDINATLSNADTYGQLFTLEGLGADDSNIDHINVDIYGDKAKTDYKTTVTLTNVPPSISLDVAKYGDEAYKKIYGDVAPADFIPQQYYCSITAFDGAQRYPADGSEQTAADLLGNPTSDYYIYEEISNSVLKQAKVTDIYHILNGSFGLDSSRSSGIDTAAILDTLALKKKTVGSFVLDPKNNPTYSIAGKPTLLAGENAECLKLDSDYTVSNDSDITVQVNIGLDNSPIVNDDNFKVYFQKCKFENGKYVGYGDLIEAPVVANGKKKIGSNYQFTVNVKSSANGLEVEKPYLVIVDGKDENNQPIVAANNGYGFYLVSLSSAPTLKNIIPSDATVYVKEDGSLTIQGVTRLTEGKPVVSIRYGEIEWDSKTVTDADLVEGKTDEYNFEFTIPNTTFKTQAEKKADNTSPASTEFALEIRSSNGEDKSTSTYKTVYFDVDNPEVNEVSITPEINTTEPLLLNGEISVTGLVEDIFSGVKGWKYQVWKKNATAPSRESAFQTQSRVSFTYDTTLIEDLSEIDIKILAEDKAGNEYPKVIVCKIDQSTDKPKFEAQDGVTWEAGILNPYYINAHAADVQSKNIISGGISSKITDDDSVAYVLFEVQAVKPKTEVSEENKADPAYVGYDADATATANLESSERYALYKKTGKEVSVTHKMPGTTGFYFITQTAYDKNFKFGADLSTPEESAIRTAITTAEANAENKNYFTKKTYVVKIPGTGPQYTLTQDTKYVSEYQRDNSKTVKVTINIENGEAPYTFKRNGEAITPTKINDNTYEDEILVSDIYKADGDIVVTYAITDANDTTKKTVQYYRDNVKPTFTKAKIEPDTEDYSVFKKSDYYYLNNEKQKFTVSGQASDSVSGVETIKLEIINVDASGNKINSSRVITDSNKTGFFDEIEFANYEYKEDGTTIKKRNYWQYGAKITVTVTDAAGNVSDETVFNVKFDTQGPNGVHEFDQKGKDLYFRFGEANRAEDDGKTGNTWAPAWDDGLDKDVGGKYSQDTYGKLKTLQIRGLFEDDGSGVSLIYYTIFDHEPSSSEISSFEENYATEKKGYFSVRSTPETKRVFYTDKTTGNKTYKNIDSNYKETISGLDNEMNYLVFVAVDNVGNAAVEDVLFNENHYHDYKLNVDQTSPTITSNENATIYVNGETAKTISGRYTDMGSWLDTKKNKMTISFESETIDTTQISDTISNVTVTKNAEDNGGTISSLTLKEDKYDYLRENARIKIGDNYYFVSDYNEASRKSSGTIKFTPKFTGTDVEYKVEFGAGIWEAEIPAETLKSYSGNTLSVYATAYDNAGDGNQTIALNMAKIIVDREYPKAEIESLNSTINNTIPLRITANDNNGIKHIELQYKKKSETAESAWKKYDEITASDSVTISNPYTWTVTLDTTDTTKFADETEYDFRAVATDLADNIGNSGSSRDATTPEAMSASKTKTALISQDSDRPIIKIRELDFTEKDDGQIKTPHESLTFTLDDDDGVIIKDNVKYKFDNTANHSVTYVTTNLTYASGVYTLSGLEQGTQKLWFQIKDNAGTTFEFAADGKTPPKVKDSNDVEHTENQALTLKVDTKKPTVQNVKFYNGTEWKDIGDIDKQVFGGKENGFQSLKISLYAHDANPITGVTLVIPEVNGDNDAEHTCTLSKPTTLPAGISSATIDGKDADNNDITLSLYYGELTIDDKFATSQRNCTLTVTDNVKPNDRPVTLRIDNSAPTFELQSPRPTKAIIGDVEITGRVNDNDGGIGATGADAIKYYIPTYSESTNTSIDSSALSWEDAPYNGNLTFSLTLDHGDLNEKIGYGSEGSTSYNNYKNFKNSEGLYQLPIWLRLEDDYGNVDYDKTTVVILYNADADTPVVDITSPTHDSGLNDSEYVTMGGTIKIQGTAEDGVDNIAAVYLQFDLNGDGTFENGSGIDNAPSFTLENIPNKGSEKGVRAVVKAAAKNISWSYELDVLGLADETVVKVRAIAVDQKSGAGALVSAWSEPLCIHVENTKPNIRIIGLRRYSAEITAGTTENADNYQIQKEYDRLMDFKTKDGFWYIYGEAYVKTGNHITEIKAKDDVTFVWELINGSGTSTGSGFCWSDNSGVNQKFLIPIAKTTANGEWETTLSVKGFNGNEGKNENETTVSLKIDNTDPAFTEVNTTNPDTLGTIKLRRNRTQATDLYEARDKGLDAEKTMKNENGKATIAGGIEENGSGFKRVAFYLKRVSTIYNVMETSSNTTTDYTNNTEKLPAKSLSGTVAASTSTTSATFTPTTIADVTGNNNIRKGGLVKIGYEYKLITEVNRITGVVSFEPECDSKYVGANQTAEFIYAFVVDRSGEEANADGTEKTGDGDGMYENFTATNWEANINTSRIPDGPIEVHCVLFDEAGNTKYGWTKTFINNKAPRITRVQLGTDLNADDKYDLDTEFETFYYNSDNSRTSGGYRFDLSAYRTSSTTEYWTAKKGLVVIPEFVGGNDDIYYTYSKAPTASGEKIDIAEAVDRTNSNAKLISSDATIIKSSVSTTEAYTLSNLAATDNKNGALILENDKTKGSDNKGLDTVGSISTSIGDYTKDSDAGINVYRFSFRDSTNGGTVAADTQWCVLNIIMKQDLADGTAPTGSVTPFYWTGNNGESVIYETENGKLVAKGHIELAEDWTAQDESNNYLTPGYKKFKSGTTGYTGAEYDADPKVSGKIKIEGVAYDETMLKTITVALGTKTVTATYSSSNGWTYNPATQPDSYKLEVTDADANAPGATQAGHSVKWSLVVDTSLVNTGRTTGLDETISVTINDAATTSNSVSKTQKVDIVPYITGISTGLDNAYRNNPSVFNRSATGAYPVRRGENITISGFNLKNGTAVPTLSIGSTTADNSSDTSITASIGTGTTVRSGDLNVTVSYTKNGNSISVKSLNNESSKNAVYNQEKNGLNNDSLTDARTLKVWSFNTVVTDSAIRYPTMRVGKDTNQTVGFVYDSVNTVRMNKGSSDSDFQVDNSFSQWYGTGLAVDKAGRLYAITQNGDSGSVGEQSYETGTGSDGDAHANGYFYAWNTKAHPGTVRIKGPYTNSGYTATSASTASGRSSYSTGTKKVAIENLYNGSALTPERIQNPKLITSSGTDNGSDAKAYVVYYDSASAQIRYRYGTITGDEDNDSTTFSGALINHDNKNYGSAADYQIIAGTGSSGTNSIDTGNAKANTDRASEYSAIGLVPKEKVSTEATSDVVVVAWYDAAHTRLLFSYNTNPSGTDNDTKAQWGSHTKIIDDDFAGWYVDMVVDPDGGIHIAYYGASAGDLKYAYLSSFTSNPKICTVDSYLSVGTNISIDVSSAKENILKANGETTQVYVPRISYFMGAQTKTSFSVRTAWPYKLGENDEFVDGAVNDKFTGNWEAMTVPTNQTPLDYTVGIGIKNNNAGNASAFLGYGTKTGLQTAALQ